MTNKISRLQENRTSFFLLGLVLSLLFVWASFELITSNPVEISYEDEIIALSPEIEIMRTAQRPQQSTPPPALWQSSGNIQLVNGDFSAAQPVFIDTAIVWVTADPEWTGPGPAGEAVGPPPMLVMPEVEAPMIIAEVMPRFPACEDKGLSKEERQACAERALLQYVYENLEYPDVALDNGISGQVVVRFVVEKDGSISSAEVLREIGGGCGQAVLDVVNSMPRWIPGSQQGMKVRVFFKLPVQFAIAMQ